jgi:hypothetical protein
MHCGMHYGMHCEIRYATMLAHSALVSCVLVLQKGDVSVERLKGREGRRSQDLLIFRCLEDADPTIADEGWSDFDLVVAVHFDSCQTEN